MQTVELICILPLKEQGRSIYIAWPLWTIFSLLLVYVGLLTDKSHPCPVIYCVFSSFFSLFFVFLLQVMGTGPCSFVLAWTWLARGRFFAPTGFVLPRGVLGYLGILFSVYYPTLATRHVVYCSYIIRLNCDSREIIVALHEMKYSYKYISKPTVWHNDEAKQLMSCYVSVEKINT